ncbi:MAG TPA: FAD-binding oxidoreductase [Armatimonadota bacterium]|nr:FAD-binding oxidoreductase [Armatimonadota bacterium]
MGALSDKLRALEGIVGEAHLLTATEGVGEYRLEGQQPVGVVSPGTPEEVAAVLQAAAGFSVLLRGAGRHLHLGAPPTAVGLVVSLARLDRIVDYDAENLTITAQAGVTLEAVQRAAGERGQMLPLDPPGGDGATLGGVVAANLAGTLRTRYGPPRDLVIGLRVALADGSLVKTGGKTVKNVAGYELTKLFVGSLGTLGAICEATVRLAPAPEARAVLAAALPPERARAMAGELLGARLEVTAVDVANEAGVKRARASLPLTIGPETRVVFVGLMGDRTAIDRQERDIRQMVGAGCARLDEEEAAAVWRGLRELPYPTGPEAVVARAAVLPARALDVLDMVTGWDGWWALARPGDGFVYAGPPVGFEQAETERKLESLRTMARESGGHVMLEAGPVDLKRSFPVWDEVGNVDLMRALKEAYDPARSLGCGRYLPGL